MSFGFKLSCVLVAILLFLASGLCAAQEIELSPAQQQMLSQLPPAQRQQAMDAIRRLQAGQGESEQATLNEPLTEWVPPTEDIDAILGAFEVRAEPGSRLILSLTPIESLTARDLQELTEDPLLSRLSGNHHFVLDDTGTLSLLGIAQISLLGLTAEEIDRRLSAESYLANFDIESTILRQELTGIEALKPFGYDLFMPKEAAFDAPSSGPVPPDYVLGPGDSIRVQLFGNVNGIYEHEVSRDGVLHLPEIGPVSVAGRSFSEFRSDLANRVQEMLIGTQVSVSMGQLRTIRVFVLGDVVSPGSYVVSGLATMSSALYQSGGISEVGSLRGIQLKRNGRVVSTLDVYDLLIRGNTLGDRRLLPGDAIFVPPIGKTVAVAGAVNRPAIYEVRSKTTAADLVGLAGGLKAEAFREGARLERIGEDGDRSVIAVNLASESANTIRIRKGDTLIVPEVLPEIRNAVVLEGHVHRPGNYPWHPGMRLSDLIRSTDELKPEVDSDYVLVRREAVRGEPVEVLSTSLRNALHNPGSDANLELKSRDTVHVFSLAVGRQRVMEPLLEELRRQATIDIPANEVEVSGNVRAPGIYPLESDMRVSDLIRAGGNLSEAAYALKAELTRYVVYPGGGRESEVINIDLDAVRRGDDSADLLLQQHDFLSINQIPEWDSIWSVSLEGEVVFPGTYRVRRGETLADVVQRAGGLTPAAFGEGAVFLRESLKEREQEQIETLVRRLQADLVSLSLQTATSGGTETLSTGEVLLDQLRETEAVGRMVIDLPELLRGRSTAIEMRDGDRLLVPTRTQVVTVLGETQQNTSHVYREDVSRDDYIDLSGGLTRRADKKLIYIVRANGAVVAGDRSRWFGRGRGPEIRPGDTIVVPLDTDRMRPLAFWGSVTQILYQGAIAVAAVRTFNN